MTELRLRRALATDSGMWAIWEPTHFAQILDYDSWEKELLDDADIVRHIKAGVFVPITIHSDGVCEFELRVGSIVEPANLDSEESSMLAYSSAHYLLRSSGEMCMSGIEHIGRDIDKRTTGVLKVPAGNYAIDIHMIEWDKVPNAKDAHGNPTPITLPDFIVLANPIEIEKVEFSVSLDTFPPP